MLNQNIDDNYQFQAEIEWHQDYTMSDGSYTIGLHVNVYNHANRRRTFKIESAKYRTYNRMQIEQDYFLCGYYEGKDDYLLPNSIAKAVLIFNQNKLNRVSEGDTIYIPISLLSEGIELTFVFQYSYNKWQLIEKTKIDTEIKLSPAQLKKDLLKKIERFDAFEENLHISIENISIEVNRDNSFTVHGELHSKNGTQLKQFVALVCVLYDREGSIITQDYTSFNPEKFFGFDLFKFHFFDENIGSKVGKIRIFPKK